MNLPWDLILEYLFKYLDECQSDKAQRVTYVRSRPVQVFMAAHRAARKVGYTGAELRDARSIIVETITSAPDEDLTAFCNLGPSGLVTSSLLS